MSSITGAIRDGAAGLTSRCFSVHVADVDTRGAVRPSQLVRAVRRVGGVIGADAGFAAPLGPSVVPHLQLRRVVLVAVCETDEAIDALSASAAGAVLAGGWSLRGEVVRASGSWPGLDPSAPSSRRVADDGPVAVLTLGKLRAARAVAFFRASALAEAEVVASSGLVWATGMGRPPFVGTCSVWDDAAAMSTFAYGRTPSGHASAMSADRRRPFHHRSAFVRLRPYAVAGSLGGVNPLPADRAADLAGRLLPLAPQAQR
jgi:hypothetical protein